MLNIGKSAQFPVKYNKAMYKQRAQMLKRVKLPTEGQFCNYSHRICMQNRLEGYEYCSKHLLEDKNAPYKQCNYMSNKSGKRCPNAAPKSDRKDGYCADHARKAAYIRQRTSRKARPRETPETLLEDIEHYNEIGGGGGDNKESKRQRPSADSLVNRILDYASSSDSDGEMPVVDQAWRGDMDSDAESIDSEQEDPLKHAGVYTAEEVALVTRDKLIRLQSLYIDQFKRLQHVLKEKRRKLLMAKRMEAETLGSIHAAKSDPHQKDKYDKLMALKRYHKRHGKEALLHRQSKERRIAVSEGANYKAPPHPKCTHISSGNIKCAARTVPLAKFCIQHILEDPNQVLFKPCGWGYGTCVRPVAAEEEYCALHIQLQEAPNRLNEKDDTQDEEFKESANFESESESKPEMDCSTTNMLPKQQPLEEDGTSAKMIKREPEEFVGPDAKVPKLEILENMQDESYDTETAEEEKPLVELVSDKDRPSQSKTPPPTDRQASEKDAVDVD